MREVLRRIATWWAKARWGACDEPLKVVTHAGEGSHLSYTTRLLVRGRGLGVLQLEIMLQDASPHGQVEVREVGIPNWGRGVHNSNSKACSWLATHNQPRAELSSSGGSSRHARCCCGLRFRVSGLIGSLCHEVGALLVRTNSHG